MSDIREEFENYLWETLDKLFKECDGDLNKLSAKEVEIVRIWRLEVDMYNGGFIQFFCNWGEENLLETQKILKKINAKKSLELINQGYEIVSKLKNDSRITELWDIPRFLSEEDCDRLQELDELYWKDLDDIQKLGYETYLKNVT
ncbi:MAG: DUF4375 domain-containing protein [Moraxellaceae bacterium]|nr:DUF4375 domain-containing protein [Moraxellaceae bacterium]